MTTERKTTHNSTYPKVAVQCFNQAFCYYQSLCLVDSESLRNRHLRVAANRYLQLITMDWKQYEDVTKHVYESLGKDKGVTIECHGSACKVTGKSSVRHQVDVLTTHSDGLHTYRTAIECKYWDKRIDKDIIMKVAEIVEDAGLSKGIIVSKVGFTPDAISFASYKGIGLVELREMTDEDWKGRLKEIHIDIHMLDPRITGLELVPVDNSDAKFESGKTNVGFLQVVDHTGTSKEFETYAEDFVSELCKKQEGEIFTKSYPFEQNAKIINTATKEELRVRGFKISGELKVSKSSLEIRGQDHVWMIMKSVFEQKTFTIWKDGKIKERRD